MGSIRFLPSLAFLVVACTAQRPEVRRVAQEPTPAPKSIFDPSRASGETEYGVIPAPSASTEEKLGAVAPRAGETAKGSSQVNTSSPASNRDSFVDPNFCKGLPAGSCFTLVVQIPSPEQNVSMGLNVLSMTGQAPSYQGAFQRTCEEGLLLGWKHLLADAGVKLWHREGVFKKVYPAVKKTRCLFQTVRNENTLPPELDSNQHGLSVKLVAFGLDSETTSTSPAFGKFQFKKSKMAVTFRDPMMWSTQINEVTGTTGATGTTDATGAVGPKPFAWRPLPGFDGWKIFRQTGVFPTSTKRIGFGTQLMFDFSIVGSSRYVEKVLLPSFDSALKGEGLGKMGIQAALVRQQLKELAKNSGALRPYVILAAIGIDALRDFCKVESADCRIQGTNENVVDRINTIYNKALVIPSETKAAFVDGTKYIPFAVLSSLVEGMDRAEFKKVLATKIPERPR
jgi:hypothetical protein